MNQRDLHAHEMRRIQKIQLEVIAELANDENYPAVLRQAPIPVRRFMDQSVWLLNGSGTFMDAVYRWFRAKSKFQPTSHAIMDFYGLPDESFQFVWTFKDFVDSESPLRYGEDLLGQYYARSLSGKAVRYQKMSWFKYLSKIRSILRDTESWPHTDLEPLTDDALQLMQTYIMEEANKARSYDIDFVSGYELAERYPVVGSCMSKWNYFINAYNIDPDDLYEQNLLNRAPGIALYAHNPDKVRMALIRKSSSTNYLGRSLVWKNDAEDGKEYHDRVYSASTGASMRMQSMFQEMGILPIIEAPEPNQFYVKLREVGAVPYFDHITDAYRDGKGHIYAVRMSFPYRQLEALFGEEFRTWRSVDVHSTRSWNPEVHIDKGIPFFHETRREIVWRNLDECDPTGTECSICGEHYREAYGHLANTGQAFCENCFDLGAVQHIEYRSPNGDWVQGYYEREDLTYCNIGDEYRLPGDTCYLPSHDAYAPLNLCIEDFRGDYVLAEDTVEVFRDPGSNNIALSDDPDVVEIDEALQPYCKYMSYALESECVSIEGTYFPYRLLRKGEVPQDLVDMEEAEDLVELFKRALAVWEYQLTLADKRNQTLFPVEMANASI